MLPLLRAAHAQPTAAVTAMATALAVSAGRGAAGSALVGAAVLTGQLSVGWSNDVADRDRDRRAGRTDKPIVAGQVAVATVAWAACVAAVACIGLSLASGWRAGLVHIGEVAVAWAYNLGLKATVLSPVPYAVSFGALPAFVTLGLPGHPLPPGWAMTAAALLGAGAHFVNTLPDLDADRAAGVWGLPQRLGRRPSLLIGAALLAASALAVAVLPAGGSSPLAVVLLVAALASTAAVVALALTGRDRASWTLTLATAGLTVALFLAHGAQLAP